MISVAYNHPNGGLTGNIPNGTTDSNWQAIETRTNGTKIHRHQRYDAPAGTSLEAAGVVPSTVKGENKGKPFIYKFFSLFVRGTTVQCTRRRSAAGVVWFEGEPP